MLKKEIAGSFLKLAASGNIIEAYDRYVDHNFVHHNQYFKGDRHALMAAMADAYNKIPNKSIEIKHIYQDGDNVITHSKILQKTEDLASVAVVHIFKFKENRIVELWDLGQEIIKDSPNENGPF